MEREINRQDRGRDPHDNNFLPDFCALRTVFMVVILCALFSIVLTLSRPSREPWIDLGIISLLLLWIGLLSTALLCYARPLFLRLGTIQSGIAAYLMLLLISSLVFEASYQLFPMGIDNHPDFLIRNITISAIIIALTLRYFYIHQQWRHRIEAELEARLEALQARIRPHFLFNSMNTIASLIRANPDAAEEAVEDLADLFRASLRPDQTLDTLDSELLLTRSYLNMEQHRLGERLKIEWHIAGLNGKIAIPPLTIQPLVENAVYHGIEPLPGGGLISISVAQHESQLRIEVGNPISTMASGSHHQGNHIALDNIRQRLITRFGERSSLVVQQDEGSYTVRLEMPVQEMEP